jgi:hypothetical protein
MLYEPERHVPLTAEPWDEERARAAIREIVADTEASFRAEDLWPRHSLEEFPGDRYKILYWGAAGVMWALHYLAACGAARLVRDYSRAACGLHAAYLSESDAGLGSPVYMIGESGILLVEPILSPSSSVSERLHTAVEASLEAPPDLCFGATDAMVAANIVYRRTNDGKWRALLQRHLDQLWSTWSHSSEAGCHPADRDEIYRRCVEAYGKTVVVEQGCANWWRSVGDPGWGKTSCSCSGVTVRRGWSLQ